MYTWSLDSLYSSYGEKFNQDLTKLKDLTNTLDTLSQNLKTKEDLIDFMKVLSKYYALARSIGSYISLNLSVNTNDTTSNRMYGNYSNIISENAKANARFNNFVARESDSIELWIHEDPYLKEHGFFLNEIMQLKNHILSEEVEETISKMQLNASKSWEKLHSYLTSTAHIEFMGETHTITSLRNFAYHQDQAIRKAAYEAELRLSKQIEDGVAFSLNSIKGEVNTINELRGYKDPLEKTLIDSRLSKASLNALFQAMDESLDMFRKYFRHKAKLLGHKNGLPWYDLFAPLDINEQNKEYSIEDAQNMILTSFASFSGELYDLAKKAFDEKWIDYLPREGKRGGAFCSNQSQIKESRIMTNFGGSISDIITLAHELGHAYHGYLIEDFSILNTSYSMPVAETASTFCENIIFNASMNKANKTEKITLLENSISDLAQIVVDIYSRYLFESEVFERRKDEFLFADELKNIMLNAQIKTYGEGLDEDCLHPYMWINKGHYYSSSLSFYNFPYAFGGLFALGLYAQYEKEGDSFVNKYRKLLQKTTSAQTEDVAMVANIDVTDVNFWRSSLELVDRRIDLFIKLTS